MTCADFAYIPLEGGLQEYKNRKTDWNVYEENKLITNEIKHMLHKCENGDIPMEPESFIIFELLGSIRDFVARINILFYAERYFSRPECLSHWLAQGKPFFSSLQLELVSLDLEAYQKCKILLRLSDAKITEATENVILFLKYCCSGDDKDELGLGSLGLQTFLEDSKNRTYFIEERADFVELIVHRMKTVRNNQVQYQFLFSLWLLSFEKSHCCTLLSIADLIPNMLEVAKTAVKEKVKRLVVMILNNILRLCKEKAIPLFVGSKVASFVDSLLTSNITDEELKQEADTLSEALKAAIQKLSTFDEYASEIQSGQLEWSPPHKSVLFWKDNAAKLDENNLEILKLLANIISSSPDPLKLAIACHDIGQYIDNNPHGKRNVEKLGLKESIMRLISHDDSEVRFYALSTVQKYMSNLWSTI